MFDTRNAIINTAFMVLGGVIGYFTARSHYTSLADEEIKSVIKSFEFDQTLSVNRATIEEVIEDLGYDHANEDPLFEVEEVAEEEIKVEKGVQEQYTNYHKMYSGLPVKEKKEVDMRNAQERGIPEQDETSKILLITEEQYVVNDYAYDSETLIWFDENQIMTTELDEPIESPIEVVGPDAIDYLRTRAPESVFVLNHKIGMIYELAWDSGSYDPGDVV